MCAGTAGASALPVSATTSILADLVKNVGGTRVAVNTIVPAGTDAHTFQPSTAVIRGLAGSRMLFANGAGLEPWLPQLQKSAPGVPVRALTAGLKLTAADGGTDPHAWWDLGLAAGYVKNVQAALTALDPAGKATYTRNTAAYLKQLDAADAYARKQFAALPASRRQIVTNHDALNYLAARYHLKVVGAVMPGLSTEREPSARELATLILAVKKSGARVIFTEDTVDVRLAKTLAQETGTRIAPPLYTDALGPKGSAGETFLRAFRANVDTMVKALK
jgi:zinc/manganese transport system substrate-binding protein/manganese/iron transport system substrate-binding protein